jgi:hypothetical protein
MRAKTDYGLETLVRMLYLSPVVRDRSILVIGPGAQAMEEILGRMGARRVRSHHPGSPRPLPWDLAGLRGKRDADAGRTLPVRKGDVDLVFIPDLGEIDDYRAILAESARVLDPRGRLVVSVRNAECTVPISETGLTEVPEVWSLESIQELLGQYFEYVEMVGQSPFLGYALASYEAGRGREGVRLDTSLMHEEGEEPEFVVAVCATGRPEHPLSNALFQMPMAEMALVEGAPPEEHEGESEAEARLRSELTLLKRELGDRNVVVSRLEKEIERLEGEAEASRQKMFDFKQKMLKERKEQQKDALETVMRKEAKKTPETWLAERAALVRELEEAKRAGARAQDRLDEVRAKLERCEARGKETRIKLKQAESRLREEETRLPEMGRRIGELERELDEADRALRTMTQERDSLLDAARRPPAATAGDGPAGDRDRSTAELERELERRGELIRDLIRELEVLPSIMAEEGPAGGEQVHELVGDVERLRGEREELAGRAAALAAELEQARSRADEAERRSTEAAALVEMVGDALEEGGAPTAQGPQPDRGQETGRMLKDIQEAIRRIAGDPRASTVARELGLLWVDIEERRKGL